VISNTTYLNKLFLSSLLRLGFLFWLSYFSLWLASNFLFWLSFLFRFGYFPLWLSYFPLRLSYFSLWLASNFLFGFLFYHSLFYIIILTFLGLRLHRLSLINIIHFLYFTACVHLFQKLFKILFKVLPRYNFIVHPVQLEKFLRGLLSVIPLLQVKIGLKPFLLRKK